MAQESIPTTQHALRVDYGALAMLPPLAERWAYRQLLARQPGYRRRLDLRGRCWERLVDVFIFADATARDAALADPERVAFAAAHPACRDTTAALLVEEGDNHRGVLAVLLCPEEHSAAAGDDWRREQLVRNG
jgi:hypothetical protein